MAKVLSDKSDLAFLIKRNNDSVWPLNYTCVVNGDYVSQALALNFEDTNITKIGKNSFKYF